MGYDGPVINEDVQYLRRILLHWHPSNFRKFPWRHTDNPYHILIAELMLRRTRADQVVPVYDEFIRKYPTPRVLDCADHLQVAEIVFPLGLAWRVPAFKDVVRELGEKHDYQVPATREDLIALPGVGDYVAGAVLSMAFGKREWIVDTNVARVFKRHFSLVTIKEARRDKQIIHLAKEFADTSRVRDANLAILDFAAIVCKASNPECGDCPLNRTCINFLNSFEKSE